MYPYRMIAFHSNQVKFNLICGSQDSKCGHTNRSVQVKRQLLYSKIAINDIIGINSAITFSIQYNHTQYNTTLLAIETTVCVAFIITELHFTFNWPLKHTGEMELHRESVEVSIDSILVIPICLPVNCTPLLYTSLKNQPYKGLHSDLYCSPYLQGSCRSAHIAKLYVLVCLQHLSLPMSNDRLVGCFELWMRVLLMWPWKDID